MVYVKMVNISDTVKFRKEASGLFEGLIFGGAYIRRGLYSEGLSYLWREICMSKPIGLAL